MTFRVYVFFVVCILLLVVAATCNRLTFTDMMEPTRREMTPRRVQSYILPDGRRLYCAQVFMPGSLTVTCDWQNAK